MEDLTCLCNIIDQNLEKKLDLILKRRYLKEITNLFKFSTDFYAQSPAVHGILER